jgi:hypothetical protein
MHRTISMLEGKSVNCLCFHCEEGDCDSELRKRLDDYHNEILRKKRNERDKKISSDSENSAD